MQERRGSVDAHGRPSVLLAEGRTGPVLGSAEHVRDLSAVPSASVRPGDGDVVVSLESGSPVNYAVRQLPGVIQLSASSRDEALRLARCFAQRHAVDLWYSEGPKNLLLERYRAGEREAG